MNLLVGHSRFSQVALLPMNSSLPIRLYGTGLLRSGGFASGTRCYLTNAVVLVGHGAVASDMPRTLVQRLRELERSRHLAGEAASAEQVALEQQIRYWPRSPETDPYQAGMNAIAERLRQRVGRVEVAFNEFCAPSLADAIEALVGSGVTQIVVISAMITPGGSHAEKDIPQTIQVMQARHPGIEIRYAWPPELDAIARLFEDTYNIVVAGEFGAPEVTM